MTVWTLKWLISLMNSHVTPHGQLSRKLLITEVAAELFPSGNSESNRCLSLQVSHSVLPSFTALFLDHSSVFHLLLPNLRPQLWLHPSEAFCVLGGCGKLLDISTVSNLILLMCFSLFVLSVDMFQSLLPRLLFEITVQTFKSSLNMTVLVYLPLLPCVTPFQAERTLHWLSRL